MELNNDNYFDLDMQMKYMGVSQFKSFTNCEAQTMAEISGEWQRETSVALLVGSYVDAYFEGKLGEFRSKHPEIFKRDGGLKSEYLQANSIIERIERDPMMMSYLNGMKQVIMTGFIKNVPVKIKIDAYHPDKMIVDLKVMKDFAPIYLPEQGRVSFIEAWGYDIQGAVYQEIVRQNTGKRLPFYIVAATKEKVPDIGIFEVEQELLDFELEKFTEHIEEFDLIKKGIVPAERCEHCDYCKHTKVLDKVMTVGDLVD